MPSPSTFDLVKQFDAMRGQYTAPVSVSSAGYGRQAIGGTKGAYGATSGGGAAGSSGDVTPDASTGRVSFGGYEFDPGFASYVKQINEAFPGLRVASGYRDPERNRQVNGVPNSMHLTGRAVDFSGSARDMQNAAGFAESLGLRYLIHDAGSGMHLHVSS